jgi:exopolysaccharide biosynthesis polyprenyl glycosylphosphotransferase
MGVDARYLADVFEWKRTAARMDDTHSLESMSLRAVARDYRQHIKLVAELVATLAALALLAPLLVVIATAVKLQDGGPVFFVQRRHGLHRRVFPMLKFRTMVPGAEAMQPALEARNEASGPVFKIRDDPRVTRVGAFLRRTSLDELPQLFNVLAGHMSIVGPRPLPIRDVDQFDASAPMRRFSVRPGITGLWQVSGRSDLPFDRLVTLDLRYIDEWSLWMDVKIVLKTVGVVLRRRGAV